MQTREQYAAALKAQMLRAQVEQGAPNGFAESAYAATQAYLEETADKSYRPGQNQVPPRDAARASSPGRNVAVNYQDPSPTPAAQFAATYANQQRAEANNAIYQAQRQPAYQPPNRGRMAMPPVHIAPNASSTPRRYQGPQPSISPDEGRSISGRGNSAFLQDRIAALVTRKPTRADTQPSQSAPSKLPKRFNQPAVNQLAQAVNSPRKTPAQGIRHRDGAAGQQSSFTPEPRRIPPRQRVESSPPKTNRAIVQSDVRDREQESISQVALTQPTLLAEPTLTEPALAGPAQSSGVVPQDQFSTFRSSQEVQSTPRYGSGTQLPMTSSRPNFVGSRGSYPGDKVEKQVSVLSGGPNRQDTGQVDPLPTAPNPNAFQRQDPTPAAQSGGFEGNRVRPLGSLRDQNQPQDGVENSDNGFQRPSSRGSIDSQLQDMKKNNENLREGLDKRVQDLKNIEERDRNRGQDESEKPTQADQKSCEEYRNQLLGAAIQDIALDISPPASRIRDQYVAISRSWTDRLGNIVTTGTMVDLRRGYVIIESDVGLQKIPYAKLSDADWAAVSDYWQIPELCGVGDNVAPSRNWVPQTFTWKASALCHKPLYFENIQLERYGHSHGPVLQPIHSTAHFFTSLVTLPYKTAINPPTECQYALGFYRPGNCAPWLKDPIPISLDGIRRQALVVTGLALLP